MDKRRKRDVDENQDQDSTQDTAEENTIDLSDDTDEIINEWKEDARARNAIPHASLFKYDNPTGPAVSYAGRFAGDEIPNRDTIGKIYGSGRYFMNMQIEKNGKKKCSTYHFKIHPVYDEIKRKIDEERRAQTAAAIPAMSGAAAPTTQETFSIVKDILSLLLPVIKAQQPQAQRQETTAEALNSYALMQKLLKTNLFDTAATYRQLAQRFSMPDQSAGSIDDDDDQLQEQPKEKGTMEKIIDFIEPFFSIIAQKGIAGKIAAASIKAAPAFNEVLKDPSLCKMIIAYFDRTKGRQLADQALHNIGIDRAAFFADPQQPGNGQNLPTVTAKPAAPAVLPRHKKAAAAAASLNQRQAA